VCSGPGTGHVDSVSHAPPGEAATAAWATAATCTSIIGRVGRADDHGCAARRPCGRCGAASSGSGVNIFVIGARFWVAGQQCRCDGGGLCPVGAGDWQQHGQCCGNTPALLPARQSLSIEVYADYSHASPYRQAARNGSRWRRRLWPDGTQQYDSTHSQRKLRIMNIFVLLKLTNRRPSTTERATGLHGSFPCVALSCSSARSAYGNGSKDTFP
jgi:hypothetical protein